MSMKTAGFSVPSALRAAACRARLRRRDTMLGLNAEFAALNDEAKKLEAQIAGNLKALFGE